MYSPPERLPSQIAPLQQSASPSAHGAVQKVQEVSNGPLPLKLEYQAARQVGPALACRAVTKLVEAGQTELYPSLNELLFLLDQARVVILPAAEPAMHIAGTIIHVLFGHLAGQRLPSCQEQAALCSFLHRLDSGNKCTPQLTENDPFMDLAQQQDSEGHSLLYLAVRKEMTGLVEWLLNTQPASFSTTTFFTGENDEKSNPLLLAVERGYKSMVRLLVEKNADVNIQSPCGESPLTLAVKRGDQSMARLLLYKGADVALKNRLKESALTLALEKGDRAMVLLLLKRIAHVDIKGSQSDGQTLLHLAVKNHDESMARLLLEKNADVDHRDSHGMSPLLWAVKRGDECMARLLLEYGADANLRDHRDEYPLFLAMYTRRERLTYLFWEKASRADRGLFLEKKPPVNIPWVGKKSCWYRALEQQEASMVCLLMENGARGYYGDWMRYQMPFLSQEAVEFPPKRQNRLFLRSQANIDRKDDSGMTPLYWAVKQDYKITGGMIRLLLAHNADANCQDCHGKSPLHLAVESSNTILTRLLLCAGADVNIQDNEGKSPLYEAIAQNQESMVRRLLENKADVNHRTCSAQSPLHAAVEVGNESVIRLLLDKRADVNHGDHSATTPLHLAVKKGSQNVIRLLLQWQADVNIHNNEGQSPLALALQSGHAQIAQLLQTRAANQTAK